MSQELVLSSGEIAIFAPDGSIDIGNSSQLREQLLQAAQEGHRVLLLDLASVQYIDSSGLSALVAAANGLDKSGARLLLCAIDPSVRKVLELTRLDSFFEIASDRESALQKLGS